MENMSELLTEAIPENKRSWNRYALRMFFLGWWLICPAHLAAFMQLSNVNLHQDPIHFFWLVAMFVSSLAWLAVFLYLTIRRLKLGWLQCSKFSVMRLTQTLIFL